MSISKQIKKHRAQRNAVLVTQIILILLGIMHHIVWAIAGLVLINIYTCMLMGYDKRLAQHRSRFRIPESTYFIFGVLFGSLGVVLGMSVFKHKTQHRFFRLFYILLPIHVYIIYRYVDGLYLR